MQPVFEQDGVTIFNGDCRQVVKSLPDCSVNCVVTSPPYWGLRDYGTAQWEGGDENCTHRPDDTPEKRGIASSTLDGGKSNTGHQQEGYKDVCARCGARRVDNQIGLEPTPDDYVATMLGLFRQIGRVLRDDGTLWLNLGDSYSGSWGNYHPNSPPGKHGQRLKETARWNRPAYTSQEFLPPTANCGLKAKDLVGIPWRVAFALQADGWWLRQDIIWHKPNPMPESVTDRCTKAHEYIFLFAKSERYYFDQDSIKDRSITCDPRRPYTSEGAWQMDGRPEEQHHGGEPRNHKGSQFHTGKTAEHQLGRASKKPRTAGNKTHKYVEEYESSASEEHRTKAGLLDVADVPWETANKRSVWTVATKPYAGAHFAVFPPELIEPCILAGCPEGGTVLDPFLGSGTTAEVCQRNGCKCIGVELNQEYVKLAKGRFRQRSLLPAG